MKEKMYEFICNYLYSEHSICPIYREACPYTKEELRDKAELLLKEYELGKEQKTRKKRHENSP